MIITLPSTAPLPVLSRVKLLSCDIDGVMTDGSIYYDKDGQCMYKFHVLDGVGLKNAQKSGIRTCFISATLSDIISKRASVLGVDYCLLGCLDKLSALLRLTTEMDIPLSDVCHIADDVNDLDLLQHVGFPVTVPNAHRDILSACKFVTTRNGGSGAVRDLCDSPC